MIAPSCRPEPSEVQSLHNRGGPIISKTLLRTAALSPVRIRSSAWALADISWQIDIWRQLRNARDAACLRYLGTIEGRNYVVTRLVAEIAENYYHLMALDKRIENLDRIIALQERQPRNGRRRTGKSVPKALNWAFNVSRLRFARTKAKS